MMTETLVVEYMKPSISEEEIETWDAQLLAIEPWFRLGHGVPPIAYIRAFGLVARKEGLTVAEYASQAGITPTVMTRNLLDLGDRNRQREEGLGLIVQERDPYDLRKHRARLTPKGRKLSHDVNMALRRLRRTK
jgi:hypothetical protein